MLIPPYPAETPYVFDFADDLPELVALLLPPLLPDGFAVVEASEEPPVDEAASLLPEPVVEAALLSEDASFSVDFAEESAVDCAEEASALEEGATVDCAAAT